MKTIYSIILICAVSFNLNAQGNYEEAIQKGLNDFYQSTSIEEMIAAANLFERISAAESAQWLPNYYSAYIYTILCFKTQEIAEKEIYLEKAQAAIDKAMDINDKESEIHTLQGMLYQAYIGLDPAKNGMIYSGKANTSFHFAEKYNPANPRPVYLQAISIMHTPEQYGGGKSAACPLFEKAIGLFESFEPADAIAPNWGKEDCMQYSSQCSDVAEN